MNKLNNELILIGISGILLLLSTLFFSLTKININDFLSINIFSLIEKGISIEFTLFMIFLSLSIALIIKATEELDKKEAIIYSLISYILFSTIGLIIFGVLEFLLLFLFGSIGIIALVFSIQKKEGFEAGNMGGKRFALFFSLGLFFVILSTTLPIQNELEEDFASDLLTSTVGGEDDLKSSIQEPLLEATVNTQIETLNAVSSLPSFENLSEKNDVDVLTFVTEFEAIQNTIESDDYRDQIENQLSESNIFENLIENMPLINNLSEYAWFIYPFFALIFIFMVNSIILKNLIAIFYFLINLILNKNSNTKTTDTEENEYY
jgi:hypothetical protein